MRKLKRSNVVSVRPQGIQRTDYWFLPPRDEEAAKILDKFEQEENNEEGIREKNKREEVTEEKLGNIKNKSSDSSVGRVTVLPFFFNYDPTDNRSINHETNRRTLEGL